MKIEKNSGSKMLGRPTDDDVSQLFSGGQAVRVIEMQRLFLVQAARDRTVEDGVDQLSRHLEIVVEHDVAWQVR